MLYYKAMETYTVKLEDTQEKGELRVHCCKVCGQVADSHLKCASCEILISKGHYEKYAYKEKGKDYCSDCWHRKHPGVENGLDKFHWKYNKEIKW